MNVPVGFTKFQAMFAVTKPPDSSRLHYPRPSDFKGSGVVHTCCQSVPGCITGASWWFFPSPP